MTSTGKRFGALAGSAFVLAVAAASGQDHKAGPTHGSRAVKVFNSVESRTTIVSIPPDAARVQKGDVLCELDPREIEDRLTIQDIAIRSAQADAQAARLIREAAELAVTEYTDAGYPKDLLTVEADIKLAEADLAREEDAVNWIRRMYDKGYVSLAEKVIEELQLMKCKFALEQAQSKRKVLVQYTRSHTMKELSGAVETARARELARQADLERQRVIRKQLTDQIRRCKVVAPVSGLLHHVASIGAGAVAHDGQLLFLIDPEAGTLKQPE